MSKNLFNKLQESTKSRIKLVKEDEKSKLDTAGQSQLNIIGHFSTDMLMRGSCKNVQSLVNIKNKFYVVDNLRIECIIGANVLYSNYCTSIASKT